MVYPDGFSGNTSKMTNPITGEVFDSLLWETDEMIYLVKLPKLTLKSPSVDDDEDDEDFEDDFDAVDAKDDDDSVDDDDDDDSYGDEPDEDGDDEDDE